MREEGRGRGRGRGFKLHLYYIPTSLSPPPPPPPPPTHTHTPHSYVKSALSPFAGGDHKENYILDDGTRRKDIEPPHPELHGSETNTGHSIVYPDVPKTNYTGSLNTDTTYIDHTVMTFDSNGGTWRLENCNLSIPEGAIARDKIIAIEIGVSVSTQLVSLLPRGLKSVSPIIQLCVLNEPKFKFAKPVTIQIQHFLDITHSRQINAMNLHFLKSYHDLTCFHPTDGAEEFQAGAHHGTLSINHFCSFCIAAHESSIDASRVYYYVMSAIPRQTLRPKWEAVFCIVLYTCTRVSFPLTSSSDDYFAIWPKTLPKIQYYFAI